MCTVHSFSTQTAKAQMQKLQHRVKASPIEMFTLLFFLLYSKGVRPDFTDELIQMDTNLKSEGYHAPRPNWTYFGEHGFDQWCTRTEFEACCHSQDLHFGNYELPPNKLVLSNDGHTALLTFDMDYNPFISNGPLGNNTYILDNIHFHWGSQNQWGSEHTIDGESFPLEMHFVHRDPIYPSCMDAEDHSEGIAVIAVLFKVRDQDNAHFREIVYNLKNVRYKNDKWLLKPFSLGSLLPPHYWFYYTYNGSLTTPPCTETVKWIIFHEPVYISVYQLDSFRYLQKRTKKETENGAAELHDNFRPVQSIGARDVSWSKEFF